MLHFVFYAIVAFFLYQFAMNIDWNSTGRDASRTAGSAVEKVEDSSVGRTVSDSVGALRDLLP